MSELPSSESSASVQKPSNKTGVIILFVIVVFLLLAGIVSLYLWTENQSSQDTTAMPTQPVTLPSVIMPTENPASSISGTMTPGALDPSAAQVRVLNGSGTAGSAQQVAASLRTAGFTNVIVGNANAFAYEGITIQVTAESSGYLPVVREAIISSDPTVEITTTVDETILGDVVVIVGK